MFTKQGIWLKLTKKENNLSPSGRNNHFLRKEIKRVQRKVAALDIRRLKQKKRHGPDATQTFSSLCTFSTFHGNESNKDASQFTLTAAKGPFISVTNRFPVRQKDFLLHVSSALSTFLLRIRFAANAERPRTFSTPTSAAFSQAKRFLPPFLSGNLSFCFDELSSN